MDVRFPLPEQAVLMADLLRMRFQAHGATGLVLVDLILDEFYPVLMDVRSCSPMWERAIEQALRVREALREEKQ